MGSTLSPDLGAIPLKMLRSSTDDGLKKLQDCRRAHGRVLERAIQIAGYSKKEAADELGQIGANQLAAWLSGTENAQTWRWQQHPKLGPALLLAHAEVTRGATVEHVIRVSGATFEVA